MFSNIKNTNLFKLFITMALIGICSILFMLLTNKQSACIFYNITGIPCPSCGMTRAWVSLFKGDIKTSFFYHPLFFIPVIIFLPNILNLLGFKIFKNAKNEKLFYFVLIICIIICWTIRMFYVFPNYPMNINYKGILPYIWNIISNIN